MPGLIERLRTWLTDVPPRVVDIAITVAVSAATVGPALVPSAQPWWVVALAVLASVPVLWRRRAPLVVTCVVGLAMTALVMWEKPMLPYGPLVGTYTIAALSPPLLRLAAVPVIGAGVYVSLALPHEGLDSYRVVGTAFVAAYALGTSTRARRARAAELAERALRLERERAIAAAHERARIARDMHDILTHSVGLIVVQAEAGPLMLQADPVRARAAFDAIADTGRGAIAQLRTLLGTMRSGQPGSREPQPGLAALPELLEQTGRSGLRVTLTSDGVPRSIPVEVDVAAYRIVQEALTNVLRHADARSARVRLRWTPGALAVEVADDGKGTDGKGTDGEGAGGEGHGLIGMRERAAACGGTLRAGRGEKGFVVAASLPVG
ncbi:histidine kinase [Nonomuraea sp. NPDC049158]|uniref:sensor histidine kinase n=1 Tax=Nonomuraea sp. NPDC049158 TaxID=3155649 RepID=UPI0033F1E4F9